MVGGRAVLEGSIYFHVISLLCILVTRAGRFERRMYSISVRSAALFASQTMGDWQNAGVIVGRGIRGSDKGRV